jgi:hypothetical protein
MYIDRLFRQAMAIDCGQLSALVSLVQLPHTQDLPGTTQATEQENEAVAKSSEARKFESS